MAGNTRIQRVVLETDRYQITGEVTLRLRRGGGETVAASPFVAAFTEMGIPYADHIMNAVVLTAVLSCLNSGLYTASRMLFVLAARREAPVQLITVNSRGVPTWAILFSTVVGFLCVIAAAISPDTIFAFLLNSSGAVILFVYLLIAVSQIVLRYRADDSQLRVKMWLFPVLSILTFRTPEEAIEKAKADGYTLATYIQDTLMTLPMGLARYKIDEFEWITRTQVADSFLFVKADSPFKTAQELMNVQGVGEKTFARSDDGTLPPC